MIKWGNSFTAGIVVKALDPDLRLSEPILISVWVTHEMSGGASQASGCDSRVAALSRISHSFLPPLLMLLFLYGSSVALCDFHRRGVNIVMLSETCTSLSGIGAPWKKKNKSALWKRGCKKKKSGLF